MITEQHYEASINYNGIILLSAYLQRQYVYRTIQVRLNGASEEPLNKVKNMLDHTEAMLNVFEEAKSLLDGQRNKLKSFADEVSLMMQNYIKENPDFNERLAVVGSTLYSEQLMNNGIIKLGYIFKQNIGKDFPARVKFYEERTKVIDVMVQLVSDGKEIEQGMQDILNKWYEGIANQKKGIMEDLSKINEMLDYKIPR
ncbi:MULTISPECIES: transcriptional regulator [Solibacillus]|uniref:Transcriptional regulator n=1 Tax=Solibacillus faecavium TaxID=2762221 RepID=A0ABR8XVY4_9BACL|nr:transcriptional regulator [Solibacillus faecavium]MBD8036101.1 transcriptional regulator [Solibacillus faecavium]